MQKEELPKTCQNCEHLKNGPWGFFICGCQCGKPENCGHPLSPCVLWDGCEEDPETGEPITPECYEDEDAILEGHRCHSYIVWLHAMHREVAHTHICEDCAVKPADYKLHLDSGSCWLCKECINARKGVKE